MASLGFMIFGCGCEMAGTTVSKAIAKWFKSKEMALAMGLEMAIARLGVFAVMWLAPMISNHFDKSVVAPVAFCTVLLIIGLLCYTVFVYMDRKFDRQLIAAGAPLDHINILHWNALIEAVVLGDGGARHQAVLRALHPGIKHSACVVGVYRTAQGMSMA